MKRILDWFEAGDLVPLAVLISVAHYGPVLVAHGEQWIVAWAVGTMVDLLHFRSVRYAFTDRRWMAAVVAAATTVMATGYHLRFYSGDWLLALPIPIGIAILAWHASEKERGAVGNAVEVVRKELELVRHHLQDRDTELQDAWEKLKEASKLLQAAESRAQEADTARAAAERRLQEYQVEWNRLNPMAQDVVRLVMTKRGSQSEIARKHGASESAVSRMKASLNGGG